MRSQRSLKRFARVMAGLTLAGAIVLPAMAALAWLFLDALAPLILAHTRLRFDPASVGVGARVGGFAVSLVGALLQAAGLLALRRTFLEAAVGRWLSLSAVVNFRRFAWISVALVFVGIAQNAAYSVLLTLGNPPGQRQLSIAFGSAEAGALFTALLFVFAAHVFAVGRAAEEENAAFL